MNSITFARYLQVVLDCESIGALIMRGAFRRRWRRGAERDARAHERRLNQATLP